MSDDRCLHCRIIAVIGDYYAERGERHGDKVVVDVHEILENIGQVAAEHIAAHPDSASRRRLVKLFHRAVSDGVPIIRARGRDHYPDHLVPS